MTNNRPPIIGLAGGIGSGKSTVAAILRDLGCVVCDSDALARQALRDPQVKQTIVDQWGQSILDGEGEISRAALAKIVFADPAQRRKLEELTHPWIESRRQRQFTNAPPGAPALVIDAPLLIEAGLDAQCDAVIFVEAPREVRLRRVMENRGWDTSELAKRELSQLPLDAKRQRADHVITNSGDMHELAAQVGRALRQITGSARR
jgi:dephospho-CoA kinase